MGRKNRTGIVGVTITIIILILIVIFSNTRKQEFSYVEGFFGKLVMPVQNGLTYLKNKLKKNTTFFSDIEMLKAENEELKKQNSDIEQKLRELEILKTENNTLKEYLNLTEKYAEYKTIPANVINTDINNFSNIIVINIGKSSGIKENMTVIADKGLVGYVISVTERTAKVRTIIDSSSSVSATISTTRDGIILKGDISLKNTLKGMYIPTETLVVIGDTAETSGMGGIYKKGIHIGKIIEVVNTKNITDRYVKVEPSVDFSKLETVLVVIDE